MAVFIITLLTPIIGVISMTFGLSFGIAFDFITSMQLFSLFPIAKLYLPTQLMKMFKWFQFYNFKFYSYLNYATLWDVSDMI